jgi:hypothetical protein
MKRLLLSLLAALALPTSAIADSTWLILRYGSEHQVGGSGYWGSAALEKIKMKNIQQCELMGAKWTGSKLHKDENKKRTILAFECLEGE